MAAAAAMAMIFVDVLVFIWLSPDMRRHIPQSLRNRPRLPLGRMGGSADSEDARNEQGRFAGLFRRFRRWPGRRSHGMMLAIRP
jgi:hypothetical protein